VLQLLGAARGPAAAPGPLTSSDATRRSSKGCAAHQPATPPDGQYHVHRDVAHRREGFRGGPSDGRRASRAWGRKGQRVGYTRRRYRGGGAARQPHREGGGSGPRRGRPGATRTKCRPAWAPGSWASGIASRNPPQTVQPVRLNWLWLYSPRRALVSAAVQFSCSSDSGEQRQWPPQERIHQGTRSRQGTPGLISPGRPPPEAAHRTPRDRDCPFRLQDMATGRADQRRPGQRAPE